jgi:phospholipid/cholesterol/gamma-HCH transport system permease protein
MNFVANIGRIFLNFLASIGRLAIFAWQGVSAAFSPPYYPKQIWRMMIEIG